MQPKGLEQVQRRFWEFIIAPKGVEQAIPMMQVRDPESVPLRNWIRAEREETAIKRLNVYADMYFFRLFEVLRDDYKYVEKAIGEERFYDLITDYLVAHPSTYPSVFYVGRHLSAYLEAHPIPDMPPWLPELARFERILTDLVLAPDSEVLAPEALMQIPPERWSMMRFTPIQALQVCAFDYPMESIWSALREGERIGDLVPKRHEIVLWRKGFTSRFETLSPQDGAALQALLAGEPLAHAFGVYLPDDIDSPEQLTEALIQAAAQAAHQALSGWIRGGMFSSYELLDAPN